MALLLVVAAVVFTAFMVLLRLADVVDTQLAFSIIAMVVILLSAGLGSLGVDMASRRRS